MLLKTIRLVKRKQLAAGSVLCAAVFCCSFFSGNGIAFSIICAAAGFFAGIAAYPLAEKRKKKKESKMFDIDMADYMINVSLLLDAGLTVWDAMRRACGGNDISRPLYRELNKALESLDSGKTDDPVSALEKMAAECEVPSVSILCGMVIQNHRKGSVELARMFRELSVSARNNRKLICMKLADEATTLLLIPSVLALIALLVILIAPAVMMLTGI